MAKSPREQASYCFKRLELLLCSYRQPRHKQDFATFLHEQWELLLAKQSLGVTSNSKEMAVTPARGGEGVKQAGVAGKGDCSSPICQNTQCSSQQPVLLETDPIAPVVPIPWPIETEVVVEGSCPNPRLLAVRLVEAGTDRKGRRCSMWKGNRGWKPGNIVKVRLDRSGKDAVYLPV